MTKHAIAEKTDRNPASIYASAKRWDITLPKKPYFKNGPYRESKFTQCLLLWLKHPGLTQVEVARQMNCTQEFARQVKAWVEINHVTIITQ